MTEVLEGSPVRAAARPPSPRRRPGLAPTVVGLVLLVMLLAIVGLGVGSLPIAPDDVVRALVAPDGSAESIVVRQLRLPRTLLAVVAGAALAVAGTVMQALTRNPLAEPGLLGVNAGASFAVVLAIAVLGVSDVAGYVWFAFAGSFLAALVVFTLANRAPAGPTRLVLAGAALGASLSSCTGIVTMYDTTAFASYRLWMVGSLENRGVDVLAWVTPFVGLGVLLALACARTLNVLALGDDQAQSLGVRLGRARLAAVTAITLLCGAATAAVGPISFLGLVVPHVLRLLIGPDQVRLVATSVLAGPALLLLADIIGRVISTPGETEAGVVTAFIGAPVLLLLVVRMRTRAAGVPVR